ncbi:replication factor C small subunit [Candidatus Woesearchaeota archaeon]|nr:replication factor C small subunit [Candidatus Woesearchaeota archaeon]
MKSSIWIEKYRPQTFEEVKGQDKIVERVKALVEKKNLPHLLFTGPAGVGKTTLSIVIAKELFKDTWRDNFLELNASDERGIDVVRVKVKDFARTRAMGDVPFKLIYLDESDALTKEAQQALRRTMENYTANCRFILAANYSSKIIDPIQSRCAVFRFKPLEKKDVFELVDTIAQKENLKVDEAAKEALFKVSKGDCRKLENTMQSCSSISTDITEDVVYSLASFAKPNELKDILQKAIGKDFESAKSELLKTMIKYGLAGTDIIKQIQSEIWNLDVSDDDKVALIDKCGEIEFRMVEGSDEMIQLEALLAYIYNIK